MCICLVHMALLNCDVFLYKCISVWKKGCKIERYQFSISFDESVSFLFSWIYDPRAWAHKTWDDKICTRQLRKLLSFNIRYRYYLTLENAESIFSEIIEDQLSVELCSCLENSCLFLRVFSTLIWNLIISILSKNLKAI